MQKVDTGLSPAALIWRRLKKNTPALAGLVFIFSGMLIALFCFLIIPDSTPDANRMCLPVSMKSPGFSVQMLKLPVKGSKDKAPWLTRIFTGTPDKFSYIAIDSVVLDGNKIRYLEYDGMDDGSNVWQSINLSDIVGASESAEPKAKLEELVVQRKFLLGTDRFGRDMFSRLILASRISLSVGFIAVLISLFVGVTLGVIAGFYGKWIDDLIVWLINVVWSVPTLLLVIAITMAMGKGMAQVFIAVGLTMWVEIARIVRGQVMSLREAEYVMAGRALGLSNFRIIFRHMLPNIVGPLFVIAASNFATAILLEAGLSFLGMGAQPPTPSWGMMIKENYGYIVVDAAYLAILPGLAIMMMVLSFTMLGNGLRDAFDVSARI